MGYVSFREGSFYDFDRSGIRVDFEIWISKTELVASII